MQEPARRWRSTRGLERALAVLFVATAVASIVRCVALATRLVVLDDPGASDFFRRAGDADSFVRVLDVVVALTVAAVIPCFIVWCYRAAKNQEVLGRRPERLGAGWAIGAWFIPLANLVLPVLVIQDLWRGSDARIERGDPRWRIADRSWLVGWWWGLLIVALVTLRGTTIDHRLLDVTDARGVNLLAIVGSLCFAASALLAIVVVTRLGDRQAQCREAMALSPV